MASIDDLFKKPSLPSNKRKLESTQNPDQIYKAAKLSNGKGKSNGSSATIEDDDDIEAGPSAPPDDDEYGPNAGDDEEGRFFESGVTRQENEILDFMEEEEEIAPEKIDAAWVRRLALNFEKKITKNSELRAKFDGQPEKFMASEADLDADIKALSILAEHSQLYGEFAKLGCVGSLVGLLAHENTDIAIDAIQIISELTDEDVEAEQDQWDEIVDAMIEADLLDLLVSNFSRFDENNESDRAGVYHALSVLENLASRESIAEKIVNDTRMMNWLLDRIPKKETSVGQNKQYAAEVLAILLQSSTNNRRKLCELDGVDLLLQILAPYRKRDPVKGTEEEEFVENIFDCLTCVVDEQEGKQKFIEAEGVELGLLMIKEGKMSRPRALRLIDHALGGEFAVAACERLVEAAGLKVIFGAFMKKQHDGQTTEHLLGIFSSLLRSLPAASDGRIRTLAKFVEKDYVKIEKLVKLRREYAARVEDEARMLDADLFCLQTVDVILAWLIAEDDAASMAIKNKFVVDFKNIAGTIQEQLDAIEGDTVEEKMTKEMLEALLQFVT